MELVVDARRLYKKSPELVEQAVQNIKKTAGLTAVSEAADKLLQIAKGEIT